MFIPALKKSGQVVFLLVGLFLLFFSLTLFSKPGANQGVQAMPRKYATTIDGLGLSEQPAVLPNASDQLSIASPSAEQVDVNKSTSKNSIAAKADAVLDSSRVVADQLNKGPGRAGDLSTHRK